MVQALASLDQNTSLRPVDVGLEKAHWRDPNRQQQHWSINDMSKNAVQFKYASLKALQVFNLNTYVGGMYIVYEHLPCPLTTCCVLGASR